MTQYCIVDLEIKEIVDHFYSLEEAQSSLHDPDNPDFGGMYSSLFYKVVCYPD